ncbi:MAG: hypothetical protein RI885_316 [Actinomycetota bacterium]
MQRSTGSTGNTVDVVIIGGGHNALVAAAYLAQSGRTVTVLERLADVGGAAVSTDAFPGIDARLSRYSYLVSLLPRTIIDDLRLDIRLLRRRYSSYTPDPRGGPGLLIDNGDLAATDASFAAIGAAGDAAAWREVAERTGHLARTVFPTMTEPLLTRAEARSMLAEDTLWGAVVDEPIAGLIERSFSSDLVRGVALTDALIGTFADPASDLAANRCYLYHVIGGGTGDWDVPVGGMGAVSWAMRDAARSAGATLVTNAEVTSIHPDGEVVYRHRDEEHRVGARTILSGVAPHALARLIGGTAADSPLVASPEGAQVKVNLLLSRLPRLKDTAIDPAAAFGGTFHMNQTWTQLQSAFREAVAGRVPDPVPAEIYCHSLTDPTILSPELAASGVHTLTVFGLHTPHRLAPHESDDSLRARLQAAVIASLDSVLAEPIDPLLLKDAAGSPTIETKTTRDLEHALGLPGGNIFHGGLEWPFVDDDAPLSTPAERWGVATAHENILLCGSGARRGGGVSGIGGHNAAMAVLERG